MQLPSSILSFDKTRNHRVPIAQILLIARAIILSIGRVPIRNPPATRANTVAITMGFKSLVVVIAYQLLTEHRARFRKYASAKANAILNSAEIAFWLAVLVVTGMGVGRARGAAAAALRALTLILAVALEVLSVWMAGCSVKVLRRAKASAGYGANAAAPMDGQSRLESYAGPPPAMQERGFGA